MRGVRRRADPHGVDATRPVEQPVLDRARPTRRRRPRGSASVRAMSLPVPAATMPSGSAGAGDDVHAEVHHAVAADDDERVEALRPPPRGRGRWPARASRRTGPRPCARATQQLVHPSAGLRPPPLARGGVHDDAEVVTRSAPAASGSSAIVPVERAAARRPPAAGRPAGRAARRRRARGSTGRRSGRATTSIVIASGVGVIDRGEDERRAARPSASPCATSRRCRSRRSSARP